MQRKLTITVADEVYRGLYQQIGRGEISRFIEGLVRPHVVSTDALEAEYRAAAEDAAAEQEALEWIEAHPDEALDRCVAARCTGWTSSPRGAAGSARAVPR